MLWDIRKRMKPALSVIEMIPNVHRTAALSILRRAVLDGRDLPFRLSAEEKELTFYDAPVQLVSPIGGRILLELYRKGKIKLKKPGPARLTQLESYVATEEAFLSEVRDILAAEEAKRARLAEIVKAPELAREEEITPEVIDKVATAQLGFGQYGSVMIAGLECHKDYLPPADTAETSQQMMRDEGRVICWWIDSAGQRRGDGA